MNGYVQLQPLTIIKPLTINKQSTNHWLSQHWLTTIIKQLYATIYKQEANHQQTVHQPLRGIPLEMFPTNHKYLQVTIIRGGKSPVCWRAHSHSQHCCFVGQLLVEVEAYDAKWRKPKKTRDAPGMIILFTNWYVLHATTYLGLHRFLLQLTTRSTAKQRFVLLCIGRGGRHGATRALQSTNGWWVKDDRLCTREGLRQHQLIHFSYVSLAPPVIILVDDQSAMKYSTTRIYGKIYSMIYDQSSITHQCNMIYDDQWTIFQPFYFRSWRFQ